jgi:peptide/nickel transport system substrate-binding protein
MPHIQRILTIWSAHIGGSARVLLELPDRSAWCRLSRGLTPAADSMRREGLWRAGSPRVPAGVAPAVPGRRRPPAGSPSYQRYCPYTAGAKDGAWHGPDLATAVRLAHESGTTQVPVTVWNNQDGFGKPVGAYLVQVLRQLGYRATVRNVSDDQFYTAAGNSSRKIQMGSAGWGADFPTASNFFRPVLSCRSFNPNPASTGNLAGFCDPHADELADQAQAAQQTDPAAARKLWASIDRILTDQAPWVPILTMSTTVFVSARVGNCQVSPYYYGPLVDQMWIR